jgi:transcriptional regulator with XRE-family HTH domain
MPRITPVLFPPSIRQLLALGNRLRLARLRRQYSTESVAKRAGIARGTLYRVETGDPGVSIATYASVLRVLGLQADLDLIARDDALGRKLQDLDLPVRKTAPRKLVPKTSMPRDNPPAA